MRFNNPFLGRWKYRSYRNQPQHVDKLEDLLFWEADLVIAETDSWEGFVGAIYDASDKLIIKGSATFGSPFSATFRAIGVPGTETDGWIYDYQGHLVPQYTNGVDQRRAIVGSVIRTVAHSNGKAVAGYVASFIAVRQD